MKFVCIHCHFYQPPRENPWLEQIELQDSAYPYHDWNARISAECYGPNLAARILDNEQRITRIVNNYSKISFNFGPTLLSWAEEHSPDLYRGLQEADKQSQRNFSGHGSATAQAYNHMILPLANSRDKKTQIRWGFEDFVRRFGRLPEGMWLPETAVDLESLDLMAQAGVQYTILAPHQAKAMRPLGDSGAAWQDATGAKIDPTRCYSLTTPSGRTINIFFYDGPVSQAVAFEKLLDNGEKFANRLLGALPTAPSGPQLVHIATDGETYGHHHRHGEMALAYALEHIENKKLAKLTNYGEFLERNPPQWEAQIYENTAWSCVHGVERWRSNCGCNSGRLGWTQEWRKPLREALDWLRDEVAPLFEKSAAKYVRDPWAARDAYISVVLDRSPAARERFGEEHFARKLGDDEQVSVWKLMEMQRHAMLMYTSCGWFFDDLSGIETIQVIQYAGRVVQLAEQLLMFPWNPRSWNC
jgi:alpha-amylase/alpha-mannosidase (GH57 family)